MDNLNGTVLRLTTRYDNRYPYDVEVQKIFYNLSNNASLITYELKNGFAVNLVLELSRMLNFSYKLVSTVGAYDFSNATDKQIDLFASSYILQESRARLVDPTYVTGKSKISAFLNQEFESTMNDILTIPFQRMLWIALIGSAFIQIGIIAACLAKVESLNLFDVRFQLISIILLRDAKTYYKKFTSHLIIWSISISSLIVSYYFSANLISTRTINISGLTSLSSLAASDYEVFIEYGYNNGSSVQEIAEAVKGSTTMTKILKKAAKNKLVFENFQQMVQEVKKRPLAYVIDDETGFEAIDEVLGHYPCNWNRISFNGLQYQWSMFMRKNMTHKKAINAGLLKLDQTGVLNLLRKRHIPHSEKCTAEGNYYFKSVSLSQIHIAFITFSAGFIAALLAILFERIYVKEWKK